MPTRFLLHYIRSKWIGLLSKSFFKHHYFRFQLILSSLHFCRSWCNACMVSCSLSWITIDYNRPRWSLEMRLTTILTTFSPTSPSCSSVVSLWVSHLNTVLICIYQSWPLLLSCSLPSVDGLLLQCWPTCVALVSSFNNDCAAPLMMRILNFLLSFNRFNEVTRNKVHKMQFSVIYEGSAGCQETYSGFPRLFEWKYGGAVQQGCWYILRHLLHALRF